MANRSDRGGEAPNIRLAFGAVLVDWLPARVFPSWPGAQTLHQRAEDTTAVRPTAISSALELQPEGTLM